MVRLTKSSPHASIAAAMYLALTRALQRRWVPSTPLVSLLESPSLPTSLPRAPGTARMNVEDSVSNASSEEDIRAWYDSSKGSCTVMRNRVR